MRDLGRRLVIALGVVVAAAAAVGYAWIAGGIAQPLGVPLGRVELPSEPGAHAFQLEDGRPAWIVRSGEGVHVVDARAPSASGAPGGLVGWCGRAEGVFLDPLGGGTFAADGRRLGGAGEGGLVVYPTAEIEGGAMFEVGRDGAVAPAASGEPVALDCPPGTPWVVHRPGPGEAFDPSVAAEEEPEGWIWIEGTLSAIGNQALLCDGLDGDCSTGAVVRGIDPAKVTSGAEALAGSFIGRVRDGALDEAHHVPDLGGTP